LYCIFSYLSPSTGKLERNGFTNGVRRPELNNISKNLEDDVLGVLTRRKNYGTVSTKLAEIFNRILKLVDEVPEWSVDKNGRLIRIPPPRRLLQIGELESDEGRRQNDVPRHSTPRGPLWMSEEQRVEITQAWVEEQSNSGVVKPSAPIKITPSPISLQTTKEEPAIEPREANLTAFASPIAAKAAEENARKAAEERAAWEKRLQGEKEDALKASEKEKEIEEARAKARREAVEQAAKAEAEKKAREKKLKEEPEAVLRPQLRAAQLKPTTSPTPL